MCEFVGDLDGLNLDPSLFRHLRQYRAYICYLDKAKQPSSVLIIPQSIEARVRSINLKTGSSILLARLPFGLNSEALKQLLKSLQLAVFEFLSDMSLVILFSFGKSY